MMNTLKNKISNLKTDKEKMYKILVMLIILIGFLIRIVGIDKIPNALNADEASAGYEAFSILNYKMDKNGKVLPAFLQAWGSGQNALLTYLIIPFIKIFGLNILTVRLPMAIISICSLIIMYKLLKIITTKKTALVGLIFFTICPWHIMKSRWGLESNLFPDLVLIAIYFLIKGLEENKRWIYYLSFVIFGLTAYSYGTSYFFLPIFLIPILVLLIRKKKITIKRAILSITTVIIISLPIILYVLINIFDLNEIRLPFLTIPKLQINRFEKITTIYSNNFLVNMIKNFIESLKVVILQTDKLPWNTLNEYGIIYMFSGIFTIIGLLFSFVKNNKQPKYFFIFNTWFITSLLLMFIVEPNINRLNILMIPIIYYTILGISIVLEDKSKIIKYIILLAYLVSFITFLTTYIKKDSSKYLTFENGLEEPIKYLNELKEKEIYVTNKIKEPYIYVLFYTKYNTKEFINTVKYDNPNKEFRQVLEFGKYHFKNIEKLEKNKNIVYLIKKEDEKLYDLSEFNIKEFENYIIIEEND